MKYSQITTKRDLAIFLNIRFATLTQLLYGQGINNCYENFEIPKKNGETRLISSPNEQLKEVQRKLSDKLVTRQEKIRKKIDIKRKVSYGFEKDENIVTNAIVHRNKRYVVNMDLKDFFDTINFGRVKGFFEKNNYYKLPKDIALIIAQITCYNGSLPQGAPTSPVIANLICTIMDFRILKIAKAFKLDYTRYADDLTFSTNDKHFLEKYESFTLKMTKEINRAGFQLNNKKTRLQYKDSRQVVTGLVVNKKISVPVEYYKRTRAMAENLYRNKSFTINGEKGTMNQLEGRFNFIDQIDSYNNKINNKPAKSSSLNAREQQYQKFLMYKTFFTCTKPIIMTEGKTDPLYLKAALKKLYVKYPELIVKNNDGTYTYKVTFLRRNKTHNKLICFSSDGGDTLANIYTNCYLQGNKYNKYTIDYFKNKYGIQPKYPVIIILDNEIDSPQADKPIKKFLRILKKNKYDCENEMRDKFQKNLINNLYLCTYKLINEKEEIEIEDLFMPEVLQHKIHGREFDRADPAHSKGHYGKEELSKYVYSNYNEIDFSNFKNLLDNLQDIIRFSQNDLH